MNELTPTPEDLSRDLAKDLTVCENATAAPWVRIPYGGSWADREDALWVAHPEDDKEGECWAHRQKTIVFAGINVKPCDIAFAVASRTGWPAAIRRALAAEAELDALRERIKGLEEQVNYYHSSLAYTIAELTSEKESGS